MTGAPGAAATANLPARGHPGALRTVILHYHLFKNAGTSVDAILQRNFGSRWVTREFDRADNSAEVAEWIASTPEAVAFSSHTASGPLPEIPGTRIVSVIFLRDPITRIRSAHAFERHQQPDPSADPTGRAIAAGTDLAGYVQRRLAIPGDRQCRNFHVARLAPFVPGPEPEFDRARAALSRFTVLGRVEAFAEAMRRLAVALGDAFPGFDPSPLHENRTEGADRGPIPVDLARLLDARNALDRALIAAAEAAMRAGAP